MTLTQQKHNRKQDSRHEDALLVIGNLFHKEILNNPTTEELMKFASDHLTRKYTIKINNKSKIIPVQSTILPKLFMKHGASVILAGSSIVLECGDGILPGRKYALKIPRPSQLVDVKKQEDTRREAINSAQMAHINVAHLAGLYQITMRNKDKLHIGANVSLLEWIDNPTPLNVYIHESCNSVNDLINILKQTLSGLQHIHEKGFIHWDIKSNNCIVTIQAGHPIVKVLDIGNARVKAETDNVVYSESEIAFTSKENLPTWFKCDDMGELKDSDRVRITLKAENLTSDRPWLDLYMFGQMIGRILGFSGECENEPTESVLSFNQKIFPPKNKDSSMAKEFLLIIYRRLTEWGHNIDPKNNQILKKPYYSSAVEVLNDLNKISPQFGAANDIRELHAVSQKTIRLPVTQNTEHSFRIKCLIDSEPFQRLNKHNQLGLTWYIYPGAKHTRFEHSLGTWATTIHYIRALYSDRTVPYFRLLCDEIDIQATLFAALVHDFGHGAFSHYLEEMASLFAGCDHEDYIQAVLLGNSQLYQGDDISVYKDHKLLLKCAAIWLTTTSNNIDRKSDSEAKIFLEIVAKILKKGQILETYDVDLQSREKSKDACHLLLNSIIDGPIDSDKMDYIRRDSYHCGVGYASGADTDRFFQSLSVALEKPKLEGYSNKFIPTIAVKKKGVGPVESLLLSRYQIFNAIYWHHTARAVTNILQYLVWRYIWSPDSIKNNNFKSNSSSVDKGSLLRERRSILLDKFRISCDEEAITWLRGELCKNKVRKNRYKQILNFDQPIKSLIERNHLPIRIFDLGYAELGNANSKSEIERGKEGTELQQRVLKIICYHQLMNNLSIENYCICREHMLFEASHKTIKLSIEKAKQLKLPDNILNELKKLDLKETNYFPDVPLQTKDQVDNLWIVDSNPFVHIIGNKQYIQNKITEEPKSEYLLVNFNDQRSPPIETIPFDMYSPMGTAIQQAFRLWARRVRIFMDPVIRDKLQDCLGETLASNCAFKALEVGYETAIFQFYQTSEKQKEMKEYLLKFKVNENYLPSKLKSLIDI